MDLIEALTSESITTELVNYALSEVERKYGTGEGDGLNPKKYHNRAHSEEVLTAARRIAQLSLEAKKIAASDISLIEIAASFHDIEQDLKSGQNEAESAQVAEEEMRKRGFNEEDIQKVKRMILASTVYFVDGVSKQSATDEYLTKIISDADLASLGSETHIYWKSAKRLLQEIKTTDEPPREDVIAFTEGQTPFLTNHQYYTEEAKALFIHKQENIEFVSEYLETLKR